MPLQPGTRLGAYEILSPLGTGGMGEVYRAHDPKLDRDVAVKVLPTETAADPERLERFQREARALAAVDHPGIVGVFSVEESGGVHFLTMQLVDGQPLDLRIAQGDLSPSGILDVALPLTDALAAAHESGIVHRDLKPANVMVGRDGRIKVLDFGLAKLAGAGSGEPAGSQLATAAGMQTREGVVMGTVPYMSPEQLSGRPADSRSDVFSLGIILYEMASGRRPFRGDSSAELISSIMRDTPPELTGLRADLPAGLSRIIGRCLEKDAGRRYPTARSLHDELQALRSQLASGPAPAPPTGASGVTLPSRPRRRAGISAIAAVAIIAVAAGLVSVWKSRPASPTARSAASASPSPSIAVLPLVNEGGSADDEYFSDGMTDELATALTKVSGLRVAARSSAYSFKGKTADAREIGEKLSVGAVLEGTVRRSGSRIRVTAQLVNATDGLVLWSEQYERDAKDVFAVQDDITGSIVSALRLKLVSGPSSGSKASQTEDTEAHDLYLRGRFFMFQQSEDGLRKALDYFDQALAKDPNYAPAYAGQAFAWAWLADAVLPPREAYPKAKAAAQKALQLDPSNVEARGMLGMILWLYDWDRSGSEQEFRRALETNPSSMDLHNFRAISLCEARQYEAGLSEADRAIALDPLNVWPSWVREYCLCIGRRYDEVIAQHRKSEELDPRFFYSDTWAGVAYREKKMYAESVAEYEKAQKNAGMPLPGLAVTYARMGKTAEARAILQQLLEINRKRYIPPEFFSEIYAALGEKDEAFVWLDKSYDARSAFLPALLYSPLFDDLRSDPRFPEMIKKRNLDR
jgi:serine/threonine-protein kinase